MGTEKLIYPVELFLRCQPEEATPIEKFKQYACDNKLKKPLQSQCILDNSIFKSYLNSHIHKVNTNEDDSKLYSKFQEALNKLSFTNFDVINNDIASLQFDNQKQMYYIGELITSKAMNEANITELFVKIIRSIIQASSVFKSIILVIIHDIFFEIIGVPSYDNLFKYIRSFDYSKANFTGLCRFLGELYNYDILNENVLKQCFTMLYKGILYERDFYDQISELYICSSKQSKTRNAELEGYMKTQLLLLLSADKNNEIIDWQGKQHKFKFPKLMHKFKIQEITQ